MLPAAHDRSVDVRGRLQAPPGSRTEATRLVLDHAFVALGLSNVILHVFVSNPAGIRSYEKAGSRRIGVRRKSKLMGGRLWDTLLMDAVAEDFESPILRRILVPDDPSASGAIPRVPGPPRPLRYVASSTLTRRMRGAGS